LKGTEAGGGKYVGAPSCRAPLKREPRSLESCRKRKGENARWKKALPEDLKLKVTSVVAESSRSEGKLENAVTVKSRESV